MTGQGDVSDVHGLLKSKGLPSSAPNKEVQQAIRSGGLRPGPALKMFTHPKMCTRKPLHLILSHGTNSWEEPAHVLPILEAISPEPPNSPSVLSTKWQPNCRFGQAQPEQGSPLVSPNLMQGVASNAELHQLCQLLANNISAPASPDPQTPTGSESQITRETSLQQWKRQHRETPGMPQTNQAAEQDMFDLCAKTSILTSLMAMHPGQSDAVDAFRSKVRDWHMPMATDCKYADTPSEHPITSESCCSFTNTTGNWQPHLSMEVGLPSTFQQCGTASTAENTGSQSAPPSEGAIMPGHYPLASISPPRCQPSCPLSLPRPGVHPVHGLVTCGASSRLRALANLAGSVPSRGCRVAPTLLPSPPQSLPHSALPCPPVETDGFSWRNYGQKTAKGAAFPRRYFKCAVPFCPAKKTREIMYRTNDRENSSTEEVVVYKCEHKHSRGIDEGGDHHSLVPKKRVREESCSNHVFTTAEEEAVGETSSSPMASKQFPSYERNLLEVASIEEDLQTSASSTSSKHYEWSLEELKRVMMLEDEEEKKEEEELFLKEEHQMLMPVSCTTLQDGNGDQHSELCTVPKGAPLPHSSMVTPSTVPQAPLSMAASPPTFSVSTSHTAIPLQCSPTLEKWRDSPLVFPFVPARTPRMQSLGDTPQHLETDFEDGYGWRKYGQKETMGGSIQRCYYRCNKAEEGCTAKRVVERAHASPKEVLAAWYKGEHSHSRPVMARVVLPRNY